MNIDKKELNHIAQLARIQLNKDEEEKMATELGSILDYIKKLDEVSTADVIPLSQVSGILNNYRKENQIVTSENNEEERKSLLKAAPDKEDGLFKVREILKR